MAATTAAIEHPRIEPRIWGLSPTQVHDRFWASRGVQVVRPGHPSDIVEAAELFLLLDPHSLVIFRLRDLVELLSWLDPSLLIVRLRDEGHSEYKEVIRHDADGRFVEFDRVYQGLDARLARIGLTPRVEVAAAWQKATGSREGWRLLRGLVPREERQARSMAGRVFDLHRDDEVVAHLECLMRAWERPDSTIPRAHRGPGGAWTDSEASVAAGAEILGGAWVGAGRSLEPGDLVAGPAILWDAPDSAPDRGSVPWLDLEPLQVGSLATTRRFVRARRAGKRGFDILFSLLVLALTLPLYPIIALAILLEDGWPVFFAHRRETLGGREFPCLKFRSMRRDAEHIKAQLQAENRSDGPQFFVENDPRSTRVGAFLRKTQLDELPQFLNVLVGHMSVVGPRPSPRCENQFCPAWREARLSVRPGVTGLWQVSRTRAEGLDFQEWIRFDLEYVERMSWHLDLKLILKTIVVVIRKALGR